MFGSDSYDVRYSGPGLYWGNNPNRLCLKVIEIAKELRPPSRRLIDLGFGEGRDLVAFARGGFQVEGVDSSTVGAKKAREWLRSEGLAGHVEVGDIRTVVLSAEYGIVYSSGTMTYLPPEIRAARMEHFKARTLSGGLHAMNAFVTKPFLDSPPDWGRDEQFYRSGELMGYYWDWEIIDGNETTFACDSGGTTHVHAMDTVLARKPSLPGTGSGLHP